MTIDEKKEESIKPITIGDLKKILKYAESEIATATFLHPDLRLPNLIKAIEYLKTYHLV